MENLEMMKEMTIEGMRQLKMAELGNEIQELVKKRMQEIEKKVDELKKIETEGVQVARL